MVSAKEKEIIINAIRVLRSRRVRPSQRKISWYVRREHLLPESTTDAVLDQLVEAEEVLRVSYKGATSYRVAANWSKAALVRRRPTRTKVNVMNSEATCRTLRAAVAAACGPYGAGATKDSIEAQLRAVGQERLLDKLDVLLHREMRAGSLLRVVTTHKNDEVVTYVLPPPTNSPTAITPESPAPSPPTVAAAAAAALGKWRCTLGLDNNQDVDDPMAQGTLHLGRESPQSVALTQGYGSATSQSLTSCDAQFSETNTTRGTYGSDAMSSTGLGVYGDGASPSAASMVRGTTKAVRGRPPLSLHLQRQHMEPAAYDSMSRQPSKRNKRAKKVFDPSEHGGMLLPGQPGVVHAPVTFGQTIPVHHPVSIGAVLPQRKAKPHPNRCDVCTNTVNHLNMHEDLLICHNCQARAHPSCLGYSAELAIRSHLAPWTCMDCKHCAICNMDHNIGTLIFCDECDQAYHLTCHQPPLSEQPQGSWICFNCIPRTNQNGYECVAGLPTPRDSPVPDDESRGSIGGPWDTQIIDSDVPNATHWGIDQVVQYFDEKGFEENSHVFRQQDIDGTSLLMLTRNDVLCSLQLKLGPALKIYKHVRILQTRLLNPQLP
ncbi:unnamed protein product [Meganyctiphanes norvegica]|uniref:Histone acetyltransferase n=1 Tax=Meganyctiphanes norvegica TaxID=48144 RepID=A0AAV2PRR6_MEGNR